MPHTMNDQRNVQYELMFGREASDAIRKFPVGYLPIGCLERHGDHLPMGLDVIKAHMLCCLAAKAIGGIVFPPHYYAGIHKLPDATFARLTGQWGNIYTDRTAKDGLEDIIRQLAVAGIKVLVLYSGHYPKCQIDMIQEIGQNAADHAPLTVIPFSECMIVQGDHAGISETSLMLHLNPALVDMTRISEVNYRDHGWKPENSPEKSTARKGEEDTQAVIAHLKAKIDAAMQRA